MTDIGTVVGTQLKLEGLERASKKHAADLTRAKEIARLLAVLKPEGITTDDVRDAFLTRWERPLQIGSAMGAIFNKEEWECVSRVQSKRAEAHARWISVWKLRTSTRTA